MGYNKLITVAKAVSLVIMMTGSAAFAQSGAYPGVLVASLEDSFEPIGSPTDRPKKYVPTKGEADIDYDDGATEERFSVGGPINDDSSHDAEIDSAEAVGYDSLPFQEAAPVETQSVSAPALAPASAPVADETPASSTFSGTADAEIDSEMDPEASPMKTSPTAGMALQPPKPTSESVMPFANMPAPAEVRARDMADRKKIAALKERMKNRKPTKVAKAPKHTAKKQAKKPRKMVAKLSKLPPKKGKKVKIAAKHHVNKRLASKLPTKLPPKRAAKLNNDRGRKPASRRG